MRVLFNRAKCLLKHFVIIRYFKMFIGFVPYYYFLKM